MDINTVATMAQDEIENLFFNAVLAAPLEAIVLAGWLDPRTIRDERISRFWDGYLQGASGTISADDAFGVATAQALENKLDPFGLVDYDTYKLGRPLEIAQELQKRAQNASIAAKLGPIARAVANNDHGLVRAIVKEISDISAYNGYTEHTSTDAHLDFVEMLEGEGGVVESFIPNLDAAIGGFENGTLAILGARPSVGKTALAWQIARNVATSGAKVAFFSLEMSARALWIRAAAPLVGVDYRNVISRRLTADEKYSLMAKSEQLSDIFGGRLVLDDRPHTTDTVWQAITDMRPDFVVVDHIRLLKDLHRIEDKRLGIITQRLKEIAKAFDVPVLALAQLNRNVESRQDKRPGMSDLRDSGQIEENADTILMLHRPDYYGSEVVQDSKTELWVEKNRNGVRQARVNLIYSLRKQWFEPERRL